MSSSAQGRQRATRWKMIHTSSWSEWCWKLSEVGAPRLLCSGHSSCGTMKWRGKLLLFIRQSGLYKIGSCVTPSMMASSILVSLSPSKVGNVKVVCSWSMANSCVKFPKTEPDVEVSLLTLLPNMVVAQKTVPKSARVVWLVFCQFGSNCGTGY